MSSSFSSGKNAIASCDRCGFQFKLTELKKLTVRTKETNIKVCSECWEEDQPQLQLGMYPIEDPQAVRDPRPDNSYYGVEGSRKIQWGWAPVGGARDDGLTPNNLVATTSVGTVTVTTT